jgi:hypothetical protein
MSDQPAATCRYRKQVLDTDNDGLGCEERRPRSFTASVKPYSASGACGGGPIGGSRTRSLLGGHFAVVTDWPEGNQENNCLRRGRDGRRRLDPEAS